MTAELPIWIEARDKPGLLLAMMREFANGSHVSFEGNLGEIAFCEWPDASTDETPALKRQTTSPKLDFVVLPLSEKMVKEIWYQLSEHDHLVREGIVHVQIESNGVLVFGGYDNFHRDCTIAYSGVSIELLLKLKQNGVIREYRLGNA